MLRLSYVFAPLFLLLFLTACDGDGDPGPEPQPDTNSLTVRSENPNDGVSISVSPADNDGATNGTTPFSRTYDEGTQITLTAPGTSDDGTVFSRWQQGSTEVSASPEATITLSQNRTLTAVYEDPDREYTLTVESQAPDDGVDIDVVPADVNGEGSGTTTFTRAYASGTEVTMTAPSTTIDDRVFVRWVLDGENLDRDERELTLTLREDRHARAVYEAPEPVVTLEIASENPASGVDITVAEEDLNGDTDGTTTFERLYRSGDTVELTAPAEAEGNQFDRWLLNGSAAGEGERILTFEITENSTATARYVEPSSDPSATLVDTSYAVGGRPSGLPQHQMQRELDILALSPGIINNGHVGIFHLRNDGVEALPDTYLIDVEDDGTADTEVTFSFTASPDEVLLDLTASDDSVFLHPSWLPNRVLIVLITENNLPEAFGEEVDLLIMTPSPNSTAFRLTHSSFHA